MIHYSTTRTNEDLQQIIRLQQCNLPASISHDEAKKEGFVSVQHDIELLKNISGRYGHVIAKHDDKVVGYALVMLKDAREDIPVLVPMFEQIDGLEYEGRSFAEISYFVMGQVCIDKNFRGQGIFKGLYAKLRDEMKNDFELVVTEIASRNTRSMQAHEAAGFKRLLQYESPEKELWEIVYWDLRGIEKR